ILDGAIGVLDAFEGAAGHRRPGGARLVEEAQGARVRGSLVAELLGPLEQPLPVREPPDVEELGRDAAEGDALLEGRGGLGGGLLDAPRALEEAGNIAEGGRGDRALGQGPEEISPPRGALVQGAAGGAERTR